MTDIHYADKDPSGGRYFRQSLSDKLPDAVTTWNADNDIDFIIELGDYINGETGQGETEAQAIDAVYDNTTADRYYVVGNHCVDDLTLAEFQANTGMLSGFGYYSFEVGDLLCIVLDAQYGSYAGDGYGSEYSGWILDTELAWIKSTLAATSKTDIAIFCHQRLDGIGTYHVNNADLVSVALEKEAMTGKKIHVFTGHHHVDTHLLVNNVYYHPLEAMVDDDYDDGGNNAYAIVKVYDNGWIDVVGYVNQETYGVAAPVCS